ncbi:hypothetical protein Bca4012_063202 [Brassica carinata]
MSALPLWVDWVNVPGYLYSLEGLKFLSRTAGKFVKLHPNTERCVRMDVARVLVEVNLTKLLPQKICFKDRNQCNVTVEVIYPWLPPRCSLCDVWGHLGKDCVKPKEVHIMQREDSLEKKDMDVMGKDVVLQLMGELEKVEVRQNAGTDKMNLKLPALSSNARPSSPEASRSLTEGFRAESPYGFQALSDIREEGEIEEEEEVEEDVEGVSTRRKSKEHKEEEVVREVGKEGRESVEDSRETMDTSNQAGSWNCIHNYDDHPLGIIWVCWSNDVEVVPAMSSAQMITCWVRVKSTRAIILASFVYASNQVSDRKILWREMEMVATTMVGTSYPWIVQGDFNVILSTSEHSRGTNMGGETYAMRDFQYAVRRCGLDDLAQVGSHFTWTNRQPENPIRKKLDRVLINSQWLTEFPVSFATFKAGGVSDHLRVWTQLQPPAPTNRKPFKFFTQVTSHPRFTDVVRNIWNSQAPLYHSRSVLKLFHTKLKSLKSALRELNRDQFGDLPKRVQTAFDDLCMKQAVATKNPLQEAFEDVSTAWEHLHHISGIEEQFLFQKSRVQFLGLGDRNNSFYHNVCKARNSKNAIRRIVASDGRILTDLNEIKAEADHELAENQNAHDVILWRKTETEYSKHFSTAATWQLIRTQGTAQDWSKVVWFQLGVPRFAFITWLAIKNRLSTGDLMQTWGQTQGRPPDPDWEITLTHLTAHIFGYHEFLLVRLAFQATIYMIWRERNDRKHLRNPRPPHQLAKIVEKTVRNRILATGYMSKPRLRGLMQASFRAH